MKTGTSSLMDGKDYKQNNSQRFDEFMDLVKSSQQEISDEEIEKAKENAWSDFEYDDWGNLYSTTFKGGWDLAIKWYREQLKQKL